MNTANSRTYTLIKKSDPRHSKYKKTNVVGANTQNTNTNITSHGDQNISKDTFFINMSTGEIGSTKPKNAIYNTYNP
jgi:hypothetical protein